MIARLVLTIRNAVSTRAPPALIIGRAPPENARHVPTIYRAKPTIARHILIVRNAEPT